MGRVRGTTKFSLIFFHFVPLTRRFAAPLPLGEGKEKRLPGGSLYSFGQVRNSNSDYSFFWTSDCPFEDAAFFSMFPGLTRVVVFTLIRASIFAYASGEITFFCVRSAFAL